jgi:hypothetical protein
MQFADHQGREAVLEVELGTEDLLALSQTRPAGKPAAAPVLTAESPTPAKRQPVSRIQVGVAAASLLAVLIGFAMDRSPGVKESAAPAPLPVPPVATRAPVPTEPVAELASVKFTNPFDRSEVFEFPAGTTRAEARARVADILIKRAQERRVRYKRTPARHTRVASR